MKTNYLLFIILCTFLLSACTAGVNKDLMSGLKISNSGLSYKEAYLSRAQIRLNTSEYNLGDTVYLYIDGIEGYTEKEGKINRGVSMLITDPEGIKTIDEIDLYASDESTGVSKEDATVTSLRLILLESFVAGKKYTWKSKIWDKNGKGEITSEVEFTLK